MARPTRRDDWDDEPTEDRQPRRPESNSFGGTLLAALGFGVTLVIGGVIGFAAGRSPREPEKTKPVEVAQNPTPTPLVVKPPEPVKPQTPEPKPKQPDPPKKEPPKKEPPKKEVPKKEPPKTVEPPKMEPKTPPPPATAVSFQKEVFPIFKAKCNSCHGDAGNPKGDLDLRTLAKALKGGDNGPGAKPGKLDESQIWKTIDDGTMPPAGKEKLTAAEIKTIKDWIVSGAK